MQEETIGINETIEEEKKFEHPLIVAYALHAQAYSLFRKQFTLKHISGIANIFYCFLPDSRI